MDYKASCRTYVYTLLIQLLLIFVVTSKAQAPNHFQCPEGCNLPPESGPCLALFQRYHYDIRENRCNEFTYGGCGGNANNFRTMEECIQFGVTCKKSCPPSMNRP